MDSEDTLKAITSCPLRRAPEESSSVSWRIIFVVSILFFRSRIGGLIYGCGDVNHFHTCSPYLAERTIESSLSFRPFPSALSITRVHCRDSSPFSLVPLLGIYSH